MVHTMMERAVKLNKFAMHSKCAIICTVGVLPINENSRISTSLGCGFFYASEQPKGLTKDKP